MIINLSQNEYLSAISGISDAVNCIIVGEKRGSNFTTGANQLSQHRQQVSTLPQSTSSSGVLFRGTLATAVQKILQCKDGETITIDSIKIINTKSYPVSGIVFYVNGESESDAITGSMTLAGNSHRSIYDNDYIGAVEIDPYSFSTVNERIVKILDRNEYSHFQAAHGTANYGKKIFIGTRGGAGASRIAAYQDYNDLTNCQIISGLENDVESMVYDVVTNKIYSPMRFTKKIIVANADDITDYTVVTLPLPGLTEFRGSSPIITDNIHLYICTEEQPNASFIKILIEDMSIVTITPVTGGAHAGTIDTANGFGYFVTGSGTLYKLDLAAMTYTTFDSKPAGLVTDDCAFIPATDPYLGGVNYVVFAAEARTTLNHKSSIGGVIVNVDDMSTFYEIDLMPSFSIKYDPQAECLINLSFDGFVETISTFQLSVFISDPLQVTQILTKTYVMRGFKPNELFMTDDGYFVTSWGTSDGGGQLVKVELLDCENPVMSQTEAMYRSVQKSDVRQLIQNKVSTSSTVIVAFETTVLHINPPTPIETLDIELPFAVNERKFGIFFGGTIPEFESVVAALTFSNGVIYAASTPTEGRGGDYMEFQYNIYLSKWLRLK